MITPTLQRTLLCAGTRFVPPTHAPRSPLLQRAQSTFTAASPLQDLPASPSPSPPPSFLPPRRRVDPEAIVSQELAHLKSQIALLCSTNLPGLDRTSKHYLSSNGKLFRPMIVFLMSRAISVAPKRADWRSAALGLEQSFNESLAPAGILRDTNPDLALLSSRLMPVDIMESGGGVGVLGTQRRLAEIVELIHTATLLHDDVLDAADTRRGLPSANLLAGNRLAVLAGDYMLGRASVYLARLRHPEVIELLATVIAELVKGELYQHHGCPASPTSPDFLNTALAHYVEKSYLKSASLISKSCRATAVLGGATDDVSAAAYAYGRALGLAFQVVDDVLDYTASGEEIGKPAGADLELGLATAPVLHAWEEYPELGPLIERRFSAEGDVALARELVSKSAGVEKALQLARSFTDSARAAIASFPDSEAKCGLEEVLETVLTRKR